jgi:tRNA U34 5-carboxymethylaminomethyl modifying GTPase MnmE/TrmE
VSIVHERAGTTRDWVRCRICLGEAAAELTDTAGLYEDGAPPTASNGGESAGALAAEIDRLAAERARQRACEADLVVLLAPGSPRRPQWLDADAPVLAVAGRCDECPPDAPDLLAVSGRTGEGVEALRAAMTEKLGLADIDPAAPRAFTVRQAEGLFRAADALLRGKPTAADAELRSLLSQ